MPRFDFLCQSCKITFEGSLPFGSKHIPPCPACKSKKVERLLTPPLGIVFKGDGFYKTDTRGKEKVSAPDTNAPAKKTEKKEAKTPPAKKQDAGA